MIELTPAAACTLYLALTLTFILSLWGYRHYKLRRQKPIVEAKKLQTCEYCYFAYLSDLKPISQCPRCHSYNKK